MKNTTIDKDTAKAEKIIFAVIQHHSQEAAAVSLGKSAATVRRWLEKPEYQELYLQARRAQYWSLRARAQQAAPAAVQTLLELALDKKVGPAAQFQACRSIVLRANTRFEEGQLSTERAEQSQRKDNEHDLSASSHSETLSEFPCEVKATARKAGATAAKINQIVLAMVQHGGNYTRAAVTCKKSAVTIWRWMQKPEVQAQYRKEVNEAYLSAQALLQHTSAMAFSFMEGIMKDRRTPASVRRQIAEFVLYLADEGAGEDLCERDQVLIKAQEESTRCSQRGQRLQ